MVKKLHNKTLDEWTFEKLINHAKRHKISYSGLRKGQLFKKLCSLEKSRTPRATRVRLRRCERDGCPAWKVRNPLSNRCIHRRNQTYHHVCTSPKRRPRTKAEPSPRTKTKYSSIVELLDNIEDITSIDEVEDENGLPSTYIKGVWYSIPKVLQSGSRTFVPTKILGHGGYGVVFAYKEEGEEKEPDTPQNTIALKLVNGKSAADTDCQGTLDYFPNATNVSQICKGVIYQRCISPTGLKVVPLQGDVSPDKLSFYIVMELMDSDLRHTHKFLTLAAKNKVVLEIKEALICLLEHGRYYADLYDSNVFFNYSKHYKGRGRVDAKDIESVKLGDLSGICKKGESKPSFYKPPPQWSVFGRSRAQKTPCNQDTMVWQFAMLVVALYRRDDNRQLVHVSRALDLAVDDRASVQSRLTEIRNDITTENFGDLPISKLKEVFNLDLDNLQKNRIPLKDLI